MKCTARSFTTTQQGAIKYDGARAWLAVTGQSRLTISPVIPSKINDTRDTIDIIDTRGTIDVPQPHLGSDSERAVVLLSFVLSLLQ